MSKQYQKSREGQSVSDETVALYTASKGFLISEWIGALLVFASFVLLYAWALRPGADATLAQGVSLVLFGLGAIMYWRSRKTYLSLDFPWKRPWEYGATVVAATGAVFWLMVLVAAALAQFGIAPF